MTFTLIHLYLLLVPGYAITILLGIRRHQLLFTITFSFAALIVLVSFARNYYWTFETLVVAFIALPASLLALTALFYRQGFEIQGRSIRRLFEDRAGMAGLAIVVVAYVIWYLVTGPYTEVPADLYRHLEFTRNQLEFLASGSLGPPLTLGQLATQQGGFWYVLLAVGAVLTDSSLIDTLYPVMLSGGLVFVIATYTFSIALFAPLDLGSGQRRLAAVLTCVFVILQMGVSAFSFVRYYGYAPALLNGVVVMAALLCVLEFIPVSRHAAPHATATNTGARSQINTITLLLVCTAIALVMHRQEAVFVGVLLISLAVWTTIVLIATRLGGRWPGYGIAVAAVGCAVLLAFVAHTHWFGVATIPQSGSGKVVALPFNWPGFGPLHILNPRFQFAEVVTIWGAVVVAGFLLRFSFFRAQPLLVAGMLSPLLTVFNPLFVDLFLRVEDDHSLWRLLFVLPLYPVAALLLVKIPAWSNAAGTASKTGWLLVAVSLIALPFSSSLNQHVRTTNLPVGDRNSYQLWSDVLEYLNTLPASERILTDPVTGYVVSGLTAHRTFRYKFLASDLYRAFRFAFESYDDEPLSKYRGWLLLVNQRDGAPSDTGRRTGHWPADIMRVSEYYPNSLLEHLRHNPDRFESLWSADQVTVYRIRD